MLLRELGVSPGPNTQETYKRLVDREATSEALPAAMEALPLVGRDVAWQKLLRAWRRAAAGRPRLALIAGEPGIGKTRLAEELLQWAERQGVATARARSYAAEGALAYTPVAELLRSPAIRPALPELESVWITEVARLVPELLARRSDVQPPEPLAESWQRRRFFEALARAVLAAPQPLLLVVDDLQWSDTDTLEWLHYLLRYHQAAGLLVVGAYRPGEVEPQHPLFALQSALRHSRQLTEIELARLPSDATQTLAAHVAGGELASGDAERLQRETDGTHTPVLSGVLGVVGVPRQSGRAETGAGASGAASAPSRRSARIGVASRSPSGDGRHALFSRQTDIGAESLEEAVTLYDRQQHRDHRFRYLWDQKVVCLVYLADNPRRTRLRGASTAKSR